MRGGILRAGKYLESNNRKYRLDFQNSGLHLRCGSTTIWKHGFSQNEALYFDSEGLTLVLLNRVREERLPAKFFFFLNLCQLICFTNQLLFGMQALEGTQIN